jgi:hypothetical protein
MRDLKIICIVIFCLVFSGVTLATTTRAVIGKDSQACQEVASKSLNIEDPELKECFEINHYGIKGGNNNSPGPSANLGRSLEFYFVKKISDHPVCQNLAKIQDTVIAKPPFNNSGNLTARELSSLELNQYGLFQRASTCFDSAIKDFRLVIQTQDDDTINLGCNMDAVDETDPEILDEIVDESSTRLDRINRLFRDLHMRFTFDSGNISSFESFQRLDRDYNAGPYVDEIKCLNLEWNK